MGLFDGYFDPQQWPDSGGLLGRLLALQQPQGQYQPGVGFDQAPYVPNAPIPTPIAQALAGQQPGSSDDANATGNDQSVISDASSDPVRPGSQYAQGPFLCALGPAGCAAGAGLTVGQAILGGAATLLGGAAILNNSAGNRPPAGSRPISQTDWSGDHGEIKKAVGAQGDDDVRIAPTGEVWAKKPDGSWENHGDAKTFTGSGKPGGRRGRDRDQ